MADRLRKESNSSLIGGGLLLVGGVALTAVTWGPYMDDEGSAAGPLIGLTAATIGFSWPLFVAMSQEWINKYYTTSEADRRIDIYNDKLRERLGLDEEDVRDIDLQTRRSPVELDLRVGPGAVALSGRF